MLETRVEKLHHKFLSVAFLKARSTSDIVMDYWRECEDGSWHLEPEAPSLADELKHVYTRVIMQTPWRAMCHDKGDVQAHYSIATLVNGITESPSIVGYFHGKER